MNFARTTAALMDVPDAALWSSRAWVDFARMPAARRARTVIVLPLFGSADWGLGRPLDLEETLGCAVLRAALSSAAAARKVIVLPPARFVLGPQPHTLFGIDLETALELLKEVAAGVSKTGFKRLAIFNTSPWNAELAEIAACDLRVESALQTFVVNLSALGFDLHPLRSRDRTAVQCAACACYQSQPAEAGRPGDVVLPGFRPGHVRQPDPLPFSRDLAEAAEEGAAGIAAAGRLLGDLLDRMARQPPLRPVRPAASVPRRRKAQ